MAGALHRFGRLKALWEYLRTSFWFVPALMALGAGALLVGAEAYDRAVEPVDTASLPWFVYVGAAEDARDILSTLLSSMITMATLVFSITMVVLTLAASQFGPRLIRSFMASPQTQLVLGAFVMTIVYCLLVLAFIASRDGAGRSSYMGVTVALALVLVSLGLLVFFLHTLARSIVSETVIERVGLELDALIDALEPVSRGASAPAADALPENFLRRAAFFGPARAGHVQVIDAESLAALADEADVLIALRFRAGDYVAQGGRGIGVCPAERVTDDLAAAIRRAILVGTHRTPVQDPEFSIRHLVEIAVRALSPGVNDPYTAIAAIDRLSASLARLMGRRLPSGAWRGSDGGLRAVVPMPTHATLLNAAFDQLRQNGAKMPVIAIHLLEALARIAEHARLPEQREALREQCRIVTEAARRDIADPSDLADITRRAEAAERAVEEGSSGGEEPGRQSRDKRA